MSGDLAQRLAAAQARLDEARQAVADEVLELLDEHGLGEIVRERLAGEGSARVVTRPRLVVTRVLHRPPRSLPAPRAETKLDARRAWWDRLVAPIVVHPAGSPERAAATNAALAAMHVRWDGKRKKVGKTNLYAHIKRVSMGGGARSAKVKAAKPPASEADDEPAPRIGTSLGAMPHRREAPTAAREAERQQLQLAGLIGNPVALAKGYEGDPDRRTACPAYNRCTSFVLKYSTTKAGDNWTCRACVGPGDQRGRNRAPSRGVGA